VTSEDATRAAQQHRQLEVAHGHCKAELDSLSSVEEAQQARIQRLAAELDGERKEGHVLQSEVNQQNVAIVDCGTKQSELEARLEACASEYKTQDEDFQ